MIHLPHLESNVTIACQLRCVSCNHFVALQVPRFKSSMLPPEILERDLSYFSRVAHVDGYAMIGGEPTLHPQLVDLLRIARKSDVADQLEVWTNGIQLVDRFPLGHPLWSSFDLLVLSRYPDKLTDDDVDRISHVCHKSGVQLRIMDESQHPNWTRLLDSGHVSDSYSQLKYDRCWFKTYSRVLDWGWFGRCCTSPFIPSVIQNRPFGSDMLRVDHTLTEDRLQAYLSQPVFMESCRSCAGRDTPSSVPITWHEERDPDKWLAESQGLTVVTP